jgi:hypothetical protein
MGDIPIVKSVGVDVGLGAVAKNSAAAAISSGR